MDLSAVRAAPGVVDVLVASDIPGVNDCGPIIHDDPIFADGIVEYVGQPIFLVLADSYDAARRAARLAKVDYAELPPVLTPQEGKRLQSYVLPPMHLVRGEPAAALARAPHRMTGEWYVGGQGSSISKARSRTRCRRKTAASTSGARRSIRPRCRTSSRMR
jgi:xanthine dehydrogenase large subunit